MVCVISLNTSLLLLLLSRNFMVLGDTGEATHPLLCLTLGQDFTAQGKSVLPCSTVHCYSGWRLALLTQVTTLPCSSVLSAVLHNPLSSSQTKVFGVSVHQISLGKELVGERQV